LATELPGISPMQAPRAVEQARSTSWLDGAKGDLNEALVLLGLVLLTLVVFIGVLCCRLFLLMFGFASTGQVIG